MKSIRAPPSGSGVLQGGLDDLLDALRHQPVLREAELSRGLLEVPPHAVVQSDGLSAAACHAPAALSALQRCGYRRG